MEEALKAQGREQAVHQVVMAHRKHLGLEREALPLTEEIQLHKVLVRARGQVLVEIHLRRVLELAVPVQMVVVQADRELGQGKRHQAMAHHKHLELGQEVQIQTEAILLHKELVQAKGQALVETLRLQVLERAVLKPMEVIRQRQEQGQVKHHQTMVHLKLVEREEGQPQLMVEIRQRLELVRVRDLALEVIHRPQGEGQVAHRQEMVVLRPVGQELEKVLLVDPTLKLVGLEVEVLMQEVMGAKLAGLAVAVDQQAQEMEDRPLEAEKEVGLQPQGT